MNTPSPTDIPPEGLLRIINELPPGRARAKYERLLDKDNQTEPALYYLEEVLAIKNLPVTELCEIHLAKLKYPNTRLIQVR